MSAFFLHELPRGYIFNHGWNFFQIADSLFSNYTNRVYHKNARFIHFTNHFICEFNELKFTHFRIQFLRLEFRWPLSYCINDENEHTAAVVMWLRFTFFLLYFKTLLHHARTHEYAKTYETVELPKHAHVAMYTIRIYISIDEYVHW